MPLKLEELLQLKIHQLHEELGNYTRPQLQALAKKCGITANQRTLELTGSLAEYIIKQKRAKGGAAGTPYSTHKTPFNPIFNPRYAPTDTKKALQTRGSEAPSTGKATGGKEWHLTKSKELAELEAALKTMPPPQRAHRAGRVPGVTPTLAPSSSKPGAPVTGKKRKYVDEDDSAVTPIEHPPAKRQPSTTLFANTLDLKRAIIRRPGGPKPAAGPSRLGRTPAENAVEKASQGRKQALPSAQKTAHKLLSNKKIKFSPAVGVDSAKKLVSTKSPMVASANNNKSSARRMMHENTPCGSRNVVHTTVTPNGSVARRPTMRAISSAKSGINRGGSGGGFGGGFGRSNSNSARNTKIRLAGRLGGSSSTSLRVAAAIRAVKAHRQA